MSVDQLEAAASALGDLRGQVVFLGGASVALWLTDPASRAPRVTYDVDVIAEVATLAEYDTFQGRLRSLAFAEDADSGVIVRWRHRSGLILDAIPLADRLAGFADRWLAPAAAEARARTLPSGARIRAISPPWLLVMKLQAFADRGNDDCLASRDFEDVVLLVDGRSELGQEAAALPEDARTFIREQVARLMTLPNFDYGFEGALGGRDNRARAGGITLPRFAALAAG